jgi:hypothetical protein
VIALWVVGEPGVGKTTLVREVLGRAGAERHLIARPKWTTVGGLVAAGHYTGAAFDGADTVPYNGARAALDFWKQMLLNKATGTIFDGDRFSNVAVREYIGDKAIQRCILMTGSPGFVQSRRDARGSKQDPTWLRGRATKALRFFQAFPVESRVMLDLEKTPPVEAVAAIEQMLR